MSLAFCSSHYFNSVRAPKYLAGSRSGLYPHMWPRSVRINHTFPMVVFSMQFPAAPSYLFAIPSLPGHCISHSFALGLLDNASSGSPKLAPNTTIFECHSQMRSRCWNRFVRNFLLPQIVSLPANNGKFVRLPLLVVASLLPHLPVALSQPLARFNQLDDVDKLLEQHYGSTDHAENPRHHAVHLVGASVFHSSGGEG